MNGDDEEEIYEEELDEECGECGGEGWVLDECFEDTCCCLDPDTQHDTIPCQTCNPKGDQ